VVAVTRSCELAGLEMPACVNQWLEKGFLTTTMALFGARPLVIMGGPALLRWQAESFKRSIELQFGVLAGF